MRLLLALCIISASAISGCKKKGCTDSTATNYSAEAKKDDGTCEYDTVTTSTEFTLTSAAIANGELLDAFKCESKVSGIENSIPLSWSNVPSGTGALAIIMEHYPNPLDLTQANSYLLLWDIDPTVTEIPYGTADDGPWYMGSDKDSTYVSYTSPCSPTAGTHQYSIVLYALDQTPASLPTTSTLAVDWDVLKTAISTVTVVDSAVLDFNDVN